MRRNIDPTSVVIDRLRPSEYQLWMRREIRMRRVRAAALAVLLTALAVGAFLAGYCAAWRPK